MPKVFISHTTADRDFVEREIVHLFERHGIDRWYCKENIQTASDWEEKIRAGLEACDWFLVVVSARSLASKWVRAEVRWAIDERPDRIVPVLMEDCNWRDFHLMMRGVQHADFRDADRREDSRRRLLEVWFGRPAAGGNPFVWRGAITEAAAFFDRERPLRTLRDFLHKRQNCQIVGPRCIGKTFLLRQIERVAAVWEAATTVASLNLQAAYCFTLAGWLRHVALQFGWPTPPADLAEFAESVEDMLAKGRHPVLCLDEFKELTYHPAEFPRDFFVTLRACGQQGLSIITASERPLSELTDPADSVSPFYNTFPLIRLGPFSATDAAAFVSVSRPKVPPFASDEQALILGFANGHPLALQVACFHMLEAKKNGDSAATALRMAEDEMKALLPTWSPNTP